VQANIHKKPISSRLFETVDKELGTVTIWSTVARDRRPLWPRVM